jgi:uncharacterized protein (TIGR01244 family)
MTAPSLHRIAVTTLTVSLTLCGLTSCSTSSSADRNGEKLNSPEPQSANTQSEDPLADLATELTDGAQPFDGIVTSGQPSREQFDRLDKTGIRTVVNFRPHDEKGAWNERERAEEMGLEYINIPIAGADDLNRPTAERFDDALRNHPAPFLVHCSSSNRVGAMFALRAFWLQDKSAEESLEIGRSAGLSGLETAVRERMSE